LTPTGEVAVETLKIGDLLTTENGESRPIRWIGRREIARDARSGFPLDALPVRIARDTFGGGSPSRDLFVSGAHLLHLNGVLIAAASLINGTTIAQIAPGVALLRYFHVEFDRHDVVLAEGAPCDSLLASPASRRTFDNYEEYVGLYGDSTGETMVPYAPIASFNGGRSEFKSRLRSALAPVIDLRHPIDVVRDTLEARALTTKAA
jgi:hypothetical protein